MFTLAKSLALFTLFSSAVLASPHSIRDAHHHRALAARHAAPEPVPVIDVSAPAEIIARAPVAAASSNRMVRKSRRGTNGRCKPRPTSSSAVASSSTVASSSAAVPSSSAAASSSAAVANVGAAPSFASSSAPAATTSVAAPAPTSTEAPVPPPQTTAAPSPTAQDPTTPAPSPTTTAASSGGPIFSQAFMNGQQSGDGTFYATGLGACGITNTDADFIAAIGFGVFDAFPGYDGVNPNNNPICGLKVSATYQGKSVTVAITDRCAGCEIATSLDFSPAAFNTIADPNLGRIHDVTWVWEDLSSIAHLA